MTTDITELAQSLKRRATSANEFGESLYVKGADVIALVEALEKAQTKNELVTGGIAVAEKLRERIAYLEKRLRGTEESLIASTDMVAELESRTVTVKLPEPFKLAKSSSGLTYYYADEVNEALSAAGIKWEAE